ncbi:conserved hypothetical protein [Desulforamulus reducens MI-1]|uniref:Uncharacterized protein n=1 Tax=Desulforamulus reducens (strain ATCC BAA-1160 / DSM 100696 / MI-1) TaxID=349161 RepID=A4J397_DESRM|nr:hypothetical protein [Desulforamulus reducens]ABO49550.1 conserved hypothetical protein [Desulforamulus reducens MI-1]
MTSNFQFSSRPSEPIRKAELSIRLSEFEIPPMRDVLLVGKKAPIGPEAVRHMVDALSPDQYEIIRMDHPLFEAAVIKKSMLKLMPQEKLLPILLEEGERVSSDSSLLKAQINIEIQVTRGVEL